jgi:ribonuclease HI
MAKKKFYVVWKGIKPGIYSSWDDCKAQVSGFEKPLQIFQPGRSQKRHFLQSMEIPEQPAGKKVKSPPSSGSHQFGITAKIWPEPRCSSACSGNPGLMNKGVFVADGG